MLYHGYSPGIAEFYGMLKNALGASPPKRSRKTVIV
jgi:hypothetical protein